MPKFITPIPSGGNEGDTRVILAIATAFMRRKGIPEIERQSLRDKVHNCHSHKDACLAIKEWFPLKPDPTRPKKPKWPRNVKKPD